MKAQLLLFLTMSVLVASPMIAGAADDVSANNPLMPPLFTIDPNSPEVTGGLLLPGDLLLPTGPNHPVVEVPAPNLGLISPMDDVDGLALGAAGVGLDWTFVLIFSVDRAAVGGVPPDPNLVALGYPFNVQDQASKNQAASDAFMSLTLFDRFGPAFSSPLRQGRTRSFNNTLTINGGDAGGVDFRLEPNSLSPASATPPGGAQSSLDGGTGTLPSPARSGRAGRLGPRYDQIYFSLAAGSPSTTA